MKQEITLSAVRVIGMCTENQLVVPNIMEERIKETIENMLLKTELTFKKGEVSKTREDDK